MLLDRRDPRYDLSITCERLGYVIESVLAAKRCLSAPLIVKLCSPARLTNPARPTGPMSRAVNGAGSEGRTGGASVNAPVVIRASTLRVIC